MSCLSLVHPVEPRDDAPLVLHEGELDVKDAAIAGVQVGEPLVHHHTVLGHCQHPGVEDDHQGDDDDSGSQDDGEVDLVLLPAVKQHQQVLSWYFPTPGSHQSSLNNNSNGVARQGND